jgi:hypothetical protein
VGTAVTNQIRSTSNLGKDFYHQGQSLLSSFLISRNTKINTKDYSFPLLCGCETWVLIPKEEHRLTVFENKVWSRIFGLNKEEKVTGGCRKLNKEEHDNLFFIKYY